MDSYRPSWDDYFMAMARIIATRSTCNRLRAGAVLVKNHRIISTGYNGAPPHLPHCDGPAGHLMEEGHCIRTVHGEENTILQAAAVGGVTSEGATLYTTYSPCYHCAKKIIVAGVKRVVAGAAYRSSTAVNEAFLTAGITLEFYQPNPQWDGLLQSIFSSPIAEQQRSGVPPPDPMQTTPTTTIV